VLNQVSHHEHVSCA